MDWQLRFIGVVVRSQLTTRTQKCPRKNLLADEDDDSDTTPKEENNSQTWQALKVEQCRVNKHACWPINIPLDRNSNRLQCLLSLNPITTGRLLFQRAIQKHITVRFWIKNHKAIKINLSLKRSWLPHDYQKFSRSRAVIKVNTCRI